MKKLNAGYIAGTGLIPEIAVPLKLAALHKAAVTLSITVLLSMSMMLMVTVFAESVESIEAELGHLKLITDGEELESEIIIFEGITYVPLHTLTELMGKRIIFDDDLQTAYITDPQPGDNEENALVEQWTKAIIFDNLEISLGMNPDFVVFDNRYSDKNGVEMLRFPIKIINTTEEPHGLNIFYYSFLNPDDEKTDVFDFYYDDSVFNAGKIDPYSILETYVYVEYTGDGNYTMAFSDFFTKDEITVTVNKSNG